MKKGRIISNEKKKKMMKKKKKRKERKGRNGKGARLAQAEQLGKGKSRALCTQSGA